MEVNFKIETEALVKNETIVKYNLWNTVNGKMFEGSGDIDWSAIRDELAKTDDRQNVFIYNNFVESRSPFSNKVPEIEWAGYIYLESGLNFRRAVELMTNGQSSTEVWTDWENVKYTGEPIEGLKVTVTDKYKKEQNTQQDKTLKVFEGGK